MLSTEFWSSMRYGESVGGNVKPRVHQKETAPQISVAVAYPAPDGPVCVASTVAVLSGNRDGNGHPTYGLWRISEDPYDSSVTCMPPHHRRDDWQDGDLLMFFGGTFLHLRRSQFYHLEQPSVQWLFDNLFRRGGIRISPDCTPVSVVLSTPNPPRPFGWFPADGCGR